MDKNKNKTEKSFCSLNRFKFNGIQVNEVWDSTHQIIILTTEEKIRSQLNTYLINIGKKSRWQVPFGMLITNITTISTSTFKPALGLVAESWKAIYYLGLIIALIWFFWCLKDAFKDTSTDGFINNIKKMS